MRHRLPRPLQSFPLPHPGAGWLGLIMFLLLAAAAWAAPEYALSGQAAALDAIVLARTPAGPITALDVLLLDEMRDKSLATVPITAWLNPNSLEATPFRPAMKGAVERLQAYRALAQKAGDWQPPADEVRVKTFGAAAAVWIENVVKPQVKVMEITDPASGRTSGDIDRYYLAHPEKYLRRLRAQVRYIFIQADMTSLTGKMETRSRLDSLKQDIDSGKIKFEEAARRFSQAPSAGQGGLLPPFYNNTFFQEFDAQTFLLDKPGKVSEVFEGPEGFYMVQLVRTWPPRNIPIGEVRDDIRRQLSLDDVRHYYNYMLAKLVQKTYVQNYSFQWDYLNLQSPIVQIDNLPLTRPNFLRFYGNPVGANYDTRLLDVLTAATAWSEGELIMKDLAQRGLAAQPWIQRAAALAALPLKADHVYLTQIPPEVYSTSQALETIRNNKQFIQGLRSAHLIEFEVQLKGKAPTPQQPAKGSATSRTPTPPPVAAQSEELNMQNAVAGQISSGVLPTTPQVNLASWVQAEATRTPEQRATDLEGMQTLLDNVNVPKLKLLVRDKDWVDIVPGTAWYEALKAVGLGHVSQPVKIARGAFEYLVLAERPVDLQDWATKPLMVRALAFQIEAAKLFSGEVLRVRQGGGLDYAIQ